MKTCPKCRRPGAFYRNASRPDGLSYWCKRCMRASCEDSGQLAARMRAYRKTARGKASACWNSIRQRAGNADGHHPGYRHVELRLTRAEFLAWAVPAFEAWLRTYPDKRGSVDRRRNDGHYELGNLRVISLSENSRRTGQHKNVVAPPGQAWCCECRAYLPRTQFYRNSHTPHGLQFVCKEHSRQANIRSRRKKRGAV